MSLNSDDEEDFAFYGTPLDPIEEDAVPSKKPTPIEEQVVRDKQGRRRFHGAFTGGFSAGYCNSVGSQEGWTPSSFKSSRSEKASLQSQKPEDFMDEEDKSEFGFAPKVLRATADYKQSSSLKRPHMQVRSGPIPGQPVLKDLLRPVRETVGVRLLRSMGWRPGQGVGPRLNHLQKNKQKREIEAASKRVYGCAPLTENQPSQHEGRSGESSDDSQDEDLPSVLFAPHDYDPFLVKTKDDVFGIGYKGLDKRPVLSGHVQLFEPSFLGMQEKKKKVAIWGQAFGVGALEEDDEDIYAKDDMSRYDFALETSATIAHRKREEREAEHRSILAKSSADANLDGFVLGDKQPTSRKKYFKPPDLPRDYKPVHTVVKVPDDTHNQQVSQDIETSKKRGFLRHELRASGRASMLDEPLPVPPLSFPDLPNSANEAPVSNSLGSSLQSSFRPFASQPDKQVRYEKFLDFAQKGQKDSLSSIQPSSMTDWDKEHERSEFEQAARLYRPLSGVMNDRFVTASQSDDNLNPLVPVQRMKHGNADMQNAAKMKMFGKLTRTNTHWQPCNLLCKRFNVPPPSGILDMPKSSHQRSKFSVFDFLDASKENIVRATDEQQEEEKPSVKHHLSSAELIPVLQNEQKPAATDGKVASTLARLLADDSGKEQLEPQEKPDLFKAIFLSSSDESDSEEEAAFASEEPVIKGGDKQLPPLRNLSPPRGIFANIDLDSLNFSCTSRDDRGAGNNNKDEEEKATNVSQLEGVSQDLLYGPRLPSSSCAKPSTATVEPVSTSFIDESQGGVWVEREIKKEKKGKAQTNESSSDDCGGEESSDSSRFEAGEKISRPAPSSKDSKKNKHRKHSKHKKIKKHKKHKSKSKHKKRRKD